MLPQDSDNRVGLDNRTNPLASEAKALDLASISNRISHSRLTLFLAGNNNLNSNLLYLEEVPRQDLAKTNRLDLEVNRRVHSVNKTMLVKEDCSVNQRAPHSLGDKLSSKLTLEVFLANNNSPNKMLLQEDFSEARTIHLPDLEAVEEVSLETTKIRTTTNKLLEACSDKTMGNNRTSNPVFLEGTRNRTIPNPQEGVFLVKIILLHLAQAEDFLAAAFPATLRSQEVLSLVEHLLDHQLEVVSSEDRVPNHRAVDSLEEVVKQPNHKVDYLAQAQIHSLILEQQEVVYLETISQLKTITTQVVAYLEITLSNPQVEAFLVTSLPQLPQLAVVSSETIRHSRTKIKEEGSLVEVGDYLEDRTTLSKINQQVEVCLATTHNHQVRVEEDCLEIITYNKTQTKEVVYLETNQLQHRRGFSQANLKTKEGFLVKTQDSTTLRTIRQPGDLACLKCKTRCFQTFMTQVTEIHWVSKADSCKTIPQLCTLRTRWRKSDKGLRTL